MHRIVFQARFSTTCALIARYSSSAKGITTTTYLAAKLGRTHPSTGIKTKKMLSSIDLTQESGSEESDEDLKLAIAMSLSQQDNSNTGTSPKPATAQPTTSSGIMGLDRKQMEAECLARQAQLKRKRGDEGKSTSISPPPLSRRTRTRSPPSSSSLKKTTVAKTKTTTTNMISRPGPSRSTLKYPNGIIKRTWISSHPQTDRDITFSELIDAPNLKSAVLSSFIWDFDWLFTQFRTKETKFMLVMHAQSPQHISLLQSDFTSIPNIRLIFPPVPHSGCMHSKLQLLFYDHHCRIVVPTANLTPSDWGECGRMENIVFVIDLPLLSASEQKNNLNSTSPFYSSLLHFLTAQAIPADVLTRLSTFDFSATATNNIAFVHSIAGSHTDPDVHMSTGRLGLSSAVGRVGLCVRRAEGESIEVDYVTSSVGSLTREFLGRLFAAMEGADKQYVDKVGVQNGKGRKLLDSAAGKIDLKGRCGITAFFSPANRNRGASRGSDDEATEDEASGVDNKTTITTKRIASNPSPVPTTPNWSTNLRIFFPSAHTIATSLGGPDAAGTICFQRRWWENGNFPRSVMRDCVAARKGVLMHSKVLLVRFVGLLNDDDHQEKQSQRKEQRKYAGWVYVGSANCSESAWGVLSGGKRRGKTTTGTKRSRNGSEGDGSSGNGNVKLTCRNWECGVVLPVPVQEGKAAGLDVFESVLPVPMVYPGRSYEGNSDLEPWFFG